MNTAVRGLICPEHVDGYTRIKEESGVTIAGGEHWHTRRQVKPFLDRRCVDYVQSDPVWCGGISEWLRICELAQGYSDYWLPGHLVFAYQADPGQWTWKQRSGKMKQRFFMRIL